MKTHTVQYEVIGRGIVQRRGMDDQHALKLLYRGDGTPWWLCNAGMELLVPPDFEAQPGDFVTITVAVLGSRKHTP